MAGPRWARIVAATIACVAVIAAAPFFGGSPLDVAEALRDPAGVDGQILFVARIPRALARSLRGGKGIQGLSGVERTRDAV